MSHYGRPLNGLRPIRGFGHERKSGRSALAKDLSCGAQNVSMCDTLRLESSRGASFGTLTPACAIAEIRRRCLDGVRLFQCGADSGECFPKRGLGNLPQPATFAQDLQFSARAPTIRIRNRPAKQVGDQRWLNQHSMNRGSTRQSVLCAVSASPECLMNRGELHRLRTGSPAHCSRPSGPGSIFPPQ